MSTVASTAGEITIAGRRLPRLGFGAMRLLGPGMTEPEDRPGALAVLRRAVELEVRIVDTCWYYGHDVVNRVIAEALRPYPDDLLLATKLGWRLNRSFRVEPFLRPEELREGNEHDRRVLGLETVALSHLRWTGLESESGGTTFDEAFATMLEMRDEGKIDHIGLSNVTLAQLTRAQARGPVASVSNSFSLNNQNDAEVVDFCTAEGIPYLPWWPLERGDPDLDRAVAARAHELGVTTSQLRLAWLLQRSPIIAPIPGTSGIAHLEENLGAAEVDVDLRASFG